MKTMQLPLESQEVQAAISRVALSLESFLLNGIPYGVIHREFFNGFLQKTVSNLFSALEILQAQVSRASLTSQPQLTEALAMLQAKCRELIELVTGLSSFRSFPLDQLLTTVAKIPLLRAECVRLIQELEGCFQIQKSFYQSRPAHLTAGVNDFLNNLEHVFSEEWSASGEHRGEAQSLETRSLKT